MVKLIEGKYESAKTLYTSRCKDFFEFNFTYAGMNENFREINRFLWESRHEKTRFRNKFEGNVLINLTSWNGMDLNEYFEAFMYFLKDDPYLNVTFLIEKECDRELLEKLKLFFEIEKTEIGLDAPAKAVRPIGFTVSDDRKETPYVRI